MDTKALTIILVLSAVLPINIFSQTPCTKEDAYNKTGFWAKQGADDLAVPDQTFSKADYTKVLAKSQKVIKLIKKANPKLTGFEGKVYRSIRGNSYVKNGALPFSAKAGYFDYYCVPNTTSYPKIRGTIQINGESGTWIYIFFNTLGWITNSDKTLGKDLRTVNNEPIFYYPKESDNFKETPILYPNLRYKNDEAIVIAPPDKNPFVILSREDYILARKREIQTQLTKSQNFPQMVKFLTDADKKFAEILAKMSDFERKSPAIIKNQTAPPESGKVFVTEKEGGQRLFSINKNYFNPHLPRSAVQLITVYILGDDKHPAKAKLFREFRENFDYQSLRQMLEK